MSEPWTDKDANGLTPHYERLAAELGPAANVAELGVLGGGSLALWQRLFPDAGVIAGVDVDPDAHWPAGTIRVVAEQDDPELAGRLAELLPAGATGYDLVVDDASHNPEFTDDSLFQLWPIVRAGGFYVIEDWTPRPIPGDKMDYGMCEFGRDLLYRIVKGSSTEFIDFRFGTITIKKRLTA